ncbi:DUF4129 domain-containing protein [Microbacterium sp. M3]|uniref:DUF4129 domain-containing protein n=2 Tax=Microbacterium arthrosphaerae TaxID=792652 RepID=A0ABU4H1Y1_9MICO|nr:MULTISPECIES: DUF4129 domain-containing protein [Microbacterium]MDW4573340.1 DUF4129 domain-containing protein [Microbacterium arthrosphaerae]MDW7607195.1 DUF4129 domain-containing protein [Microbacterium sp. M3]
MGLTSTASRVLLGAVEAVPPLTPDGDEARRWAEEELSDPAYDVAEPTPVDRIARAIGDFIASLLNPDISGAWGSTFALVATIVVIAVIVTAFLVWGMPRATRRAAARTPLLFGEGEQRSAAELRAAAAERARAGDWDQAIVLRFRALARGCLERGVVDPPPGATVHAFARAAAGVFPALAPRLEQAATVFDDVRYLRRPGTAELYRLVTSLDDALVAARPAVREMATA